MIRLEQPKLNPEATDMAVEIDFLPLESPDQQNVILHVRYLVGDQPILELDSSINPCLAEAPLTWMEKAITTRKGYLSERFCNPKMGKHLICIEQISIEKDAFLRIQKVHGEDAYPYPFEYDLDVMVNPDPKGLFFAGVGMRITGLSHVQIIHFLSQINDQVSAIWSGGALLPTNSSRK